MANDYGYDHAKGRAALKRVIATEGYICTRCHKYAPPASEFHYDHADDGNGYRGPSHPFCNEQAAGLKARANDRRRLTRLRNW